MTRREQKEIKDRAIVAGVIVAFVLFAAFIAGFVAA